MLIEEIIGLFFFFPMQHTGKTKSFGYWLKYGSS